MDDEMEIEVDEATVREFDEKTRFVAQHWRLLGQLLNVEEHRLTEIQEHFQESDRKNKMLRHWLEFKQGTLNSDKKLNKALEQIHNKYPDLQGKNANTQSSSIAQCKGHSPYI